MLTSRFDEALSFARVAHGDQLRKGKDVTYLSHLLAVSAAVLEADGDEDLAIAALLHDVVEDTPVSVADVREHFGDRVAGVVEACSDYVGDDPSAKPPWQERKQATVDHLRDLDHDALVVSLADKTHNAVSIAAGASVAGPSYWERYSPSASQTLWYYRSLLEVFVTLVEPHQTAALSAAVDEIEQILNAQLVARGT